VSSSTLTFTTATEVDAEPIASLRTAAAAHLTRMVGKGQWSRNVTERGVRYDLKTARVLVARRGGEIVATMTLATKKPGPPIWHTSQPFPNPSTGMRWRSRQAYSAKVSAGPWFAKGSPWPERGRARPFDSMRMTRRLVPADFT
jgi:hypothetical protein